MFLMAWCRWMERPCFLGHPYTFTPVLTIGERASSQGRMLRLQPLLTSGGAKVAVYSGARGMGIRMAVSGASRCSKSASVYLSNTP